MELQVRKKKKWDEIVPHESITGDVSDIDVLDMVSTKEHEVMNDKDNKLRSTGHHWNASTHQIHEN